MTIEEKEIKGIRKKELKNLAELVVNRVFLRQCWCSLVAILVLSTVCLEYYLSEFTNFGFYINFSLLFLWRLFQADHAMDVIE